MKTINLVKPLKKYPVGWVALSKDYNKVLFWGKTFTSLMKRVESASLSKDVVLLPNVGNFRGFVA